MVLTFDQLTPALREEIQLVYLRRWLGKMKRAQWTMLHAEVAPVPPVPVPPRVPLPLTGRWRWTRPA